MPTYSINTAEAIDHLVESGMPATQAKAVVQTIAASQDQLATKSDLELVKVELAGRIDALESKMDGRLDALESKMDGRLDALESKMDALETKMDARFDRMKMWIVSAIVLAVGAFKALDYILLAIGL